MLIEVRKTNESKELQKSLRRRERMGNIHVFAFDGNIKTVAGRKAEHLGTDAGRGDDGKSENSCLIVASLSVKYELKSAVKS